MYVHQFHTGGFLLQMNKLESMAPHIGQVGGVDHLSLTQEDQLYRCCQTMEHIQQELGT